MTKYGYVYCTTDLKNGMKYIGQKKSKRFVETYFGSGILIKNIKNKRPDTLRVDLIEWCSSLDELNKCEKDWTDAVGLYPLSYNLVYGGGSFKGYSITEEHRKKMSEAQKGKKLSNETKIKIGIASKNRKLSEETKQKISNSNKNKVRSIETRIKISSSLIGKEPWNKGKNTIGHPCSDETKRKIGEANKLSLKGKKWTDEQRNNFIKARTGKTTKLKGRIPWNKGIKQKDYVKKEVA